MVTSALCLGFLAACGGGNAPATAQLDGANRLLGQMSAAPALAAIAGDGQDGPPAERIDRVADGRVAGPGPGQCPEGKAECAAFDPTLADNFRSGSPR